MLDIPIFIILFMKVVHQTAILRLVKVKWTVTGDFQKRKVVSLLIL